MILTGKEIEKRILSGDIVITDFDKSRINPNSYNLRLSDEIGLYETDDVLDFKERPKLFIKKIPESGYILLPGILYLGRTVEYTETHNLVPGIEGRSSCGRLGLSVHVTAGFGDIGFKGFWTLEISCVHPIIIYPNIEICQIFYQTIIGDITKYDGKYQNNSGIQESLIYNEFEK